MISLLAIVLHPSLLEPPHLQTYQHVRSPLYLRVQTTKTIPLLHFSSPNFLISLDSFRIVVLWKLEPHSNVNWHTAIWLFEKICTVLISALLVIIHLYVLYIKGHFIATNSPRRIDRLLLTVCFSITGPLQNGGNTHAPAPQGPGFP